MVATVMTWVDQCCHIGHVQALPESVLVCLHRRNPFLESYQGFALLLLKVAHQPQQLELEHDNKGDERTILGWPVPSVYRTSAITLAAFVAAGFYFRHQRRHSAS